MPKTVKSFFNIIFVLIFLGASTSSAEVVDKIIVIVNDEIVTRGELDRVLLPIYQQYKTQYSGEELAEKIDKARSNVLNRIIEDKLLLSEAKRRKIEIKDEEVEAKMDEIKKRFATEEEFKEALKEERMLLGELEKKYRDRIKVDKMVDKEIRRSISLSPSEVINYYRDHEEEFGEPEKIKLRAILIKVNGSRTREASLKLAKEILSRLQEGGDFASLAKRYSDGPYKESGGDMAWVKKGELMDKIDNLVFTLEENELSGILQTGMGFHIFKVEQKMSPRTMDFREAKDRIEHVLYQKKTEEKLRSWIDELKENAYIAFK
ncbi:MAG: peptidylprolyl isomerase [Candidatus Omnitrophica bacterium]|nr:peptidylprolyl isomerase [Candidatus Omnitrophota bacterium]